jgi:hypothetical protein
MEIPQGNTMENSGKQNPEISPLQCDVESNGSLDVAAVARGDRL